MQVRVRTQSGDLLRFTLDTLSINLMQMLLTHIISSSNLGYMYSLLGQAIEHHTAQILHFATTAPNLG